MANHSFKCPLVSSLQITTKEMFLQSSKGEKKRSALNAARTARWELTHTPAVIGSQLTAGIDLAAAFFTLLEWLFVQNELVK